MAEGEKSYVFYSQMVLIATLTLTEVREREETGLGCVGVAEGVTVWRGKVCWSVIGTTHIHTLSSYMLYIHTYRGRVILGGPCSSCTVCPCALSTPTAWRDGGQSQMFPLERLHCEELQKRHPA